MLFSLGFIVLFTIGGLSGVVLANASLDVAFHDTVFIITGSYTMLVLLHSVTTIIEKKNKKDSLKSDDLENKNSLINDKEYIKIF